jgi:hypothetical protein
MIHFPKKWLWSELRESWRFPAARYLDSMLAQVHQYHDIKISMADTKSTPVMVRLSPEQIRQIDEWRRLQSDLPTRPEAVRRLAEIGLTMEAKTKKRGTTRGRRKVD